MTRCVCVALVIALVTPPPAHPADIPSAGGSSVNPLAPESITTTQIVQGTLQGLPRCLNHSMKPTGICFWLVCTMYGCSVQTSMRYGHFNPDVVVSSYNGMAPRPSTSSTTTASSGGYEYGNPWDDARKLYSGMSNGGAQAILSGLGPVATLFGGGERTEGGPGRPDHTYPNHQNLLFKEVDGIGHPLADALYNLGSSYVSFCQSDASILTPYYLSGLDVSGWRYAIPDMIADLDSWIPGRREIGSWPLNTWGAVMPRSGFGTQADQPKIAAVTAQRGADIFTHSNTGHVSFGLGNGQAETKMSDDGAQAVFTPDPIKENDNIGGIWQMLLPKVSKTCEIFGGNDTATVSGYGGGKVSSSGDYVYTLWRPYQCCQSQGTFIMAVPIGTYPPADAGETDAGKPLRTGSASSGSIFGVGTSTTTTSGGTGQ